MVEHGISITISQAQLRAIIGGIISAILFVGGISSTGIIRVDKFGLSDYHRLEEEHNRHEEHARKVMEYNIRKDMPPAVTKARIRAIERCLERNCTNFQPPTLEWQ